MRLTAVLAKKTLLHFKTHLYSIHFFSFQVLWHKETHFLHTETEPQIVIIAGPKCKRLEGRSTNQKAAQPAVFPKNENKAQKSSTESRGELLTTGKQEKKERQDNMYFQGQTGVNNQSRAKEVKLELNTYCAL